MLLFDGTHLTSDTSLEELLRGADALGLRREWLQRAHCGVWHFALWGRMVRKVLVNARSRDVLRRGVRDTGQAGNHERVGEMTMLDDLRKLLERAEKEPIHLVGGQESTTLRLALLTGLLVGVPLRTGRVGQITDAGLVFIAERRDADRYRVVREHCSLGSSIYAPPDNVHVALRLHDWDGTHQDFEQATNNLDALADDLLARDREKVGE